MTNPPPVQASPVGVDAFDPVGLADFYVQTLGQRVTDRG